MTDKLIPLKTVLEAVPVSRVKIWRMRRDDQFPQPRKVGSRVFWLESEIQSFVAGTWSPQSGRAA